MNRQRMDILLRDLLQTIPLKFTKYLTGRTIVRTLDTSLPSIKERKADFVAELDDGSIFHLELQTHPDKNMPLRMLEYRLLLKQKYPKRKIKQMVLYVGEGKAKMENELREEDLSYRYELRDVKELSCKELMESDKIEDKILAVLCNVKEPEKYFTRLMEELLGLPERERADYIRKLFTALQYRPKLKVVLKRLMEERKMPLTITEEMIRQDPFFQEGLERGRKEGLKEGLERGLREGLEKGLKEGLEKARRELVLNVYRNTGLSAEEIARMLSLPEEFVKKVLDEN